MKQGVPGITQNHWHSSTINRILKNKIYVGILKCGDICSDNIEYLRIIDDDTFDRAQKIIKNQLHLPGRASSALKTQVLCDGLVYCGHCGQKLHLTSNYKKYIRKDGFVSQAKRIKYKCPSKFQHHVCDGPTVYSASMLDEKVSDLLIQTFQSSENEKQKQAIFEKFSHHSEHIKQEIQSLQNELKIEEIKFTNLKEEAFNVIRGKSILDSIALNQLISQCEKNIAGLKENLRHQNNELQDDIKSAESFKKSLKVLNNISTDFMNFTLEKKQQIIHKYIRRIYVKKDWQIEINWQF